MTARIICLSELGVSTSQNLLSDAVLCFGHFNTIHPGHIRYFRTAHQYGGPLVVALEGDAQILDSQGIQVFSERERAQAVASLDVAAATSQKSSAPAPAAFMAVADFEATRHRHARMNRSGAPLRRFVCHQAVWSWAESPRRPFSN